MISFDEAVELVRSVAEPLGSETIPLDQAAGRVLAAPVIALIDSPRADVSTMDGYAVREPDLARIPARLRVVGKSFAGQAWPGTLERRACARIFTGAPVPAGADRIVIQEDVRREGEIAIVEGHRGDTAHIRRRASDFSAGDELLPKGRQLDPRAIVAAAAADVGTLEVFRLPRLQILSTGDELAEPGTARGRADAIPESVSFGVAALAEAWGACCVCRTRVRDDLAPMRAAAGAAIDSADVVVVTGGASVGEKDFAKATFEPLGLQLIFSKVAIKPGKPVWLGRVNDRIVMGLPGNPTSALVTARLLLAPLLAALGGLTGERALNWRAMPLASQLAACGPRETFHRAGSVGGRAEILEFQDSGAQKALADADLLVRQPANSPAMGSGATVEVLDF